ncbi:AraC family transcriptional regulator [Sorangium sp. So ce887]|uniref:AraC family transcriptional regulator n=1 Tax=Sorangium sp. So ce887 TaxID=3133324 RepID=UPI003F62F580
MVLDTDPKGSGARSDRARGLERVTGPIAGVVAGFVAFGMSRGLPAGEIFATAGLRPEELADPDRHVPATAMLALWKMYIERLNEPELPLTLAASFEAARFGVVGELMKSSGSVREALAQQVRYGRLTAPHLRLTMEETGGETKVVQRHHPAVEDIGGPIEFMLALLFKEVSRLAGARIEVREVAFKHRARGPVEPYEAFFGAPVRFSADATALTLPATELDRATTAPAPEVARYLEAHAARMLEALPSDEAPIVQRVRDLLAREMPKSPVDQIRAARLLAMSSRTLQRRLMEAGTTFNDLLDDLRRVNALGLLRSRDTTITDVAFLLGYSDVPAFYRAFKRWTGKTPQAFRAAT